MERPVRFNCGDHAVFGILHVPQNDSCLTHRVGLIFLNSGIRGRVGPYRLYVRYARMLCEAGFYVLRFDLPGIGDSEGHLEKMSKYRRRFLDHTDSTMHAIEFMQAETGIERIGLLGKCGGAHIALHSGAADPRVDFLQLFSLPVEDLGDFSEEVAMRVMLRQYFRKALQWRSWLNLIMLRSNFKTLAKAIGQLGHYHKRVSLVDESLWCAFKTFIASGRSILFVFGAGDPLYKAFVIGFGKRSSNLRKSEKAAYEVYVVKKSDHIFSQRKWQEEAMNRSLSWLQKSYGSK